MAGQTKKTKEVKLRIPNKEFFLIESYAQEHELNRSQAIISLIRKGLDKSESEPATKADLVAFAATIEKAIAAQPIAVQEAVQPAALPVPEEDWKSKSLLARILKK